VIVVLYLAAVVAVAVAGGGGAAWAAAVWSPWYGAPQGWSEDGFVLLALALVCPLRAWMLWQVLRGPVVRARRPPPARGVAAARLVLYLGVAVTLIPWGYIGGLYEDVPSMVVRVALVVLFTLVLTGRPPGFRLVALALGLTAAAGAVLTAVLFPIVLSLGGEDAVSVWWMFAVPGLAQAAWQTMMLLGQRSDGRWSAATVRCGALDLLAFLALLAVNAVTWQVRDLAFDFTVLGWVLAALNVFGPVWWARSAHGLADGRRPRVVSGRPRVLGGVVAVVLLAGLLGGEEGPRLPYRAPYDVSCPAWTKLGRGFGETRAEDRERAFLCLVRDAGGPMFPADRSDQALLASGRELCAQPMWQRTDTWLRSDDRTINMRSLDDALVFLCPDVLMSSDEQMVMEDADYVAASNAACRDPWPRARARRQGTAAYFTPEGGGYYLADDADPDNKDGVERDYDGLLTGGKTGVGVETIRQMNVCVTVKVFDKAPPLRLKGWQEVAEVGVTSRSGRLMVPTMGPGQEGAGRALPNLAIKGPGHYRVRVHARAEEKAVTILPAEWHLVVVYPGRSKKEVVHRSRDQRAAGRTPWGVVRGTPSGG
jgi:hypothetical protein